MKRDGIGGFLCVWLGVVVNDTQYNLSNFPLRIHIYNAATSPNSSNKQFSLNMNSHDLPPEVDEQEIIDQILKKGLNTDARPLAKDVICASLSCMGHNERGLVVYTTCTLASLCLSNIDSLASYPFLQRIVLDNNHLTTLQPLQHCRSLVSLSAAHNKLDKSVFKHVLASCASLERLDVSFNELTSLDGVGAFPYLNEFYATNNHVKQLTRGQLEGLRSLTKVHLFENQISTIDPEAFSKCCNLRHLNLAKNEISDMRFVTMLEGCLVTLNLSDNNIMHFEAVLGMSVLTTLDLSGNNIYDHSELSYLARVPSLRDVGLLGNPLCSLSHGIHDVLDDDAASDIVIGDAAAPATHASHRDSALGISSSSTSGVKRPIVPAPISKERAAAPVVDQAPEEEDEQELQKLSLEQQYRLTVLWKAPNILRLDGVDVPPQELTMSRNLRGGADRSHRQEMKTKFLSTASGSVINSIRKARGQ